MEQSRMKTQLAGVGGLIAIVAVIAVLLGMYQKVFTSVTMIEVQAPRAGLQLDPGASVRAFGVPVGEVRDVTVTDDGVVLKIALDNGKTDRIPADVTASIRATTLFGAKFVQLDASREDVTRAVKSGDTIQAGATIRADEVTLEANNLFQHAMTLLDAIDVEKLNTTLTSVAEAVDGRGERMGGLIDTSHDYLQAINPVLPQLGRDVAGAETVLGNLNELVDPALRTVDQLTTTTDLVASSEQGLEHLLAGIPFPADSVTSTIRSIGAPLSDLTPQLEPVTDLLYSYRASVPCILNVLVQHTEKIGQTVVDNYGPFISMSVGFLPGQDQYRYPDNLPKFARDIGPSCYRIATADNGGFEHITYDDGTAQNFDNSSDMADINLDPVSVYSDFGRLVLGKSFGESLTELMQKGGQ